MIIPIRCFTCGKPIAHLWETFKQKVDAGEEPRKVMEDMGLERYCCKAIFMGHEDLLEIVSKFKKA